MIFGTRIRYTCDNLGVIGGSSSELVNAGDFGKFLGPAPDNSGWLYTEPDQFPQRICPVDPSMIEEADDVVA